MYNTSCNILHRSHVLTSYKAMFIYPKLTPINPKNLLARGFPMDLTIGYTFPNVRDQTCYPFPLGPRIFRAIHFWSLLGSNALRRNVIWALALANSVFKVWSVPGNKVHVCKMHQIKHAGILGWKMVAQRKFRDTALISCYFCSFLYWFVQCTFALFFVQAESPPAAQKILAMNL